MQYYHAHTTTFVIKRNFVTCFIHW